jgi:hypothetical protein
MCDQTPSTEIPVPADVVDQHVDPRKLLEYLGSKPPHLRLRREVGNEHVHLLTTGCANLASRALGTLRVRPVIARCAPMVARPRAVALPIPLVAPVTSTVVPAIGVL